MFPLASAWLRTSWRLEPCRLTAYISTKTLYRTHTSARQWKKTYCARSLSQVYHFFCLLACIHRAYIVLQYIRVALRLKSRHEHWVCWKLMSRKNGLMWSTRTHRIDTTLVLMAHCWVARTVWCAEHALMNYTPFVLVGTAHWWVARTDSCEEHALIK